MQPPTCTVVPQAEQLEGHEAPVVAAAFSPGVAGNVCLLIATSWALSDEKRLCSLHTSYL